MTDAIDSRSKVGLQGYIASHRAQKNILLMTHIVLGYPTLQASLQVVDAMVDAGVELIELQIPFSDPMADGPVILHANQRALAAGVTVEDCFQAAKTLARRHPQVRLLLMTYYNIVHCRGPRRFARDANEAGLYGTIVPDLPHEEGQEFYSALAENELEPVFLFSPSTGDERMAQIATQASGFIYCVARKGVTGARTDFQSLEPYLARCRKATSLPLALGFGVKDRSDVLGLVGKVDIAVVGSSTISLIDREGVSAVGAYIRSLRD